MTIRQRQSHDIGIKGKQVGLEAYLGVEVVFTRLDDNCVLEEK